MPRYFIKRLKIEGFRGINNQGDPLELSFKADCVNSVFAANALGKSSIFEALSYALNGVVPKLAKLPAADNPEDYYANRFHGTGTSTVSVVFEPDDTSKDVEITITRDPAGKRAVVSPSGFPKPEELLRSLDTELALLSHDLFLEFVNDTPLKRGRTFSGLLGLSPLSDFRQVLEILSNRRNLNTDLELDTLQHLKLREERAAKEVEYKLRVAFRAFFASEPNSTLKLAVIGADALSALKNIPIVAQVIDELPFEKVDFETVRRAVKNAEASEKRDQLTKIVRSIGILEGLAVPTTEEEEIMELRGTLEKRAIALAETKGTLFRELYSIVQALYDGNIWTDPLLCPTCESTLKGDLPQTIADRLQLYKDADEGLALIHSQWKTSHWPQRLKNLEEAEATGILASERRYPIIAPKFSGVEPSLADLAVTTDYLDALETIRNSKLGELRIEKDKLERELPPSLVALTQLIEHAASLQELMKALDETNKSVEDITAKLNLRSAWAQFIEAVSDRFSQAEVRLSTVKTSALENDYRQMYDQVTNNPEIVPQLKKSDTSQELHLRLAKFYGLTNLSAATLLPESYRNALAICIYLAAALHSTSTARFIVLDDVTSSFDAGHQWALMELIRTKIGYPSNPDGPQIIILSHDGLLEKYFDTMANETEWHHQRLQGLPPKGLVYPHTQDVNRLEQAARQQLSAGQTESAKPLIRQYLEQKLLRVIRKLQIPVPLDFSIREDRKLVGNCLDAISSAIELHKRAGTLILNAQQVRDLETVHVPVIVGNWISHYSTGAVVSLSPYVYLGVLDAIDKITDCFTYSCTCDGTPQPRFYTNLSAKPCRC